jgi:hypothetical protein
VSAGAGTVHPNWWCGVEVTVSSHEAEAASLLVMIIVLVMIIDCFDY